MTSSKRQRRLAREKYERQQMRRAVASDRRRRNQRITAVVVVGVLVLGGLAYALIALRGDDSTSTASSTATPSAGSTPDTAVEPTTDSSSGTDEPIEEPAVLNCGPAIEPRADTISFDAPGDVEPATSLTLATTCGDIVITLDERAPQTIASETFLAEQGFYTAVSCHRLTTSGIFVLQCGDPRGDGTGGPGYTVPDENLPSDGEANYPAGTVAMANAGPGTAGSQFFIVYEDTTLPSDYTVWGQVTQGLDIVQEIASVGTEDGGPDGPPRQPVVIESATVQRS